MEGLTVTLIQVLSVGTPCVSADCLSGLVEILDNGQLGKLVPVGDYYILASAIESALVTPIPAEQLVQKSRQFEYAPVMQQYEAFLLSDG